MHDDTEAWRHQLGPLDGLPLLAIKGKQPFDAITESPSGWQTAKFPAHVIAACTWASGVGTRTGADANGLIVFDLDGNTAPDFARQHGCDPDLPDTWAVRRSDTTDRLKKLFQASPEQAEQLGQCRRKRNTKDPETDDDGKVIVKGEGIEIYHGVGQVLLLGNHEDGGQYIWRDGEGPEALAPLPDHWFRLALLLKEANTTKATNSSKAPRIGINGWGKIRGTCPICGRDSHPICGTNQAGDRVSCYDGVSFSWDKAHPGIKVGQAVRGLDGKEWALTAITWNDVIGADFASFKIHEPLTPDQRREWSQRQDANGNGAGMGSQVPLHPDSSATYAKGEEPIDLRAAQILQDEAAHTIACHQDAFFTYDPAAGYWSRVSADAMKRRALAVLKRIYVLVKIGSGDSATEVDSFRFGSARQVDDTIRALRSVAAAGPLERPEPPRVVVFTNGTFNLRTRTLEPHSPDHGATYAVAGPFVPDAVCPPEVQRIITTCFPDEAEPIMRALFRWIVDPTIRYGEAFHLLGGTGTGKGLILTLAQHLLPSTLVSTLSHPADLKGPRCRATPNISDRGTSWWRTSRNRCGACMAATPTPAACIAARSSQAFHR
jgi:hypothetical protein